MLIDIIFIILLIIAAVKGFSRGLIAGLFSFLAIIIGLAAAMKLSIVVSGWLQNSTNIAKQWLPFVSFAIVMIVVIILVRLGAKLIQKGVEFAMLGWLNKLGGVILYAFLFTTVFSIVLFYAVQMNIIKTETIQASRTYAYIQPFGPKALDLLGSVIPIFKNLFVDLENFFGSFVTKS